MGENTKYCRHCGEIIDADCIVCPRCGKQVEQLSRNDIPIVANNNNSASSSSASSGAVNNSAPASSLRSKDKWISLLLCIFTICGHKFYEGKIGMGIVYLFTMGLFGIGWIIDIIALLGKPNPYYV